MYFELLNYFGVLIQFFMHPKLVHSVSQELNQFLRFELIGNDSTTQLFVI